MKLKHAAALAAAVTLALATPAFGAPTNVEVGGSGAPGTHPITARSQGTVQWAMEKTDGTYLSLSCSSITATADPGTVARSGTGVDRIVTLQDLTFVGCSGAIFTNPVTENALSLKRTGGAVTAGADDRWPGRIDDVRLLHKSIWCEFVVTGRMAASFDETTQILHIQENAARPVGLTMAVAKGCGGQLKQGGSFKLSASLKITSPDGPINAVP